MVFYAMRTLAGRCRRELQVYQLVLKDSRTPRLAKWLLGLAVGYILLPFDLVPDFIPILGQMDDLVLVPLLVCSALALIPRAVVDDARTRVRSGA